MLEYVVASTLNKREQQFQLVAKCTQRSRVWSSRKLQPLTETVWWLQLLAAIDVGAGLGEKTAKNELGLKIYEQIHSCLDMIIGWRLKTLPYHLLLSNDLLSSRLCLTCRAICSRWNSLQVCISCLNFQS